MSSLFMTRNRNLEALGGLYPVPQISLVSACPGHELNHKKQKITGEFIPWLGAELGSSGWLVTDCNPCGSWEGDVFSINECRIKNHGGICVEKKYKNLFFGARVTNESSVQMSSSRTFTPFYNNFTPWSVFKELLIISISLFNSWDIRLIKM